MVLGVTDNFFLACPVVATYIITHLQMIVTEIARRNGEGKKRL